MRAARLVALEAEQVIKPCPFCGGEMEYDRVAKEYLWHKGQKVVPDCTFPSAEKPCPAARMLWKADTWNVRATVTDGT